MFGTIFTWRMVKFFFLDNWKTILAVTVGAVLLIWLLSFAFCGRNKPKIDEEKIQKINAANEAERKQELREIIEQNAETVRAVDNRTAITEANVERRDKEIEAKIKEADKKIEEAKRQGKDVTSADLECILIPENCK